MPVVLRVAACRFRWLSGTALGLLVQGLTHSLQWFPKPHLPIHFCPNATWMALINPATVLGTSTVALSDSTTHGFADLFKPYHLLTPKFQQQCFVYTQIRHFNFNLHLLAYSATGRRFGRLSFWFRVQLAFSAVTGAADAAVLTCQNPPPSLTLSPALSGSIPLCLKSSSGLPQSALSGSTTML